jgi:ADP-ribose pyrophosphatase
MTTSEGSNQRPEAGEVLFQGSRFRVERVQYCVRGDRVEKEIVRYPGAVVILPLVDDEHLCMIRNYRPAVGCSLWELPAGTLEPGEDPLVAARRELEEETGYQAASWTLLQSFYASPGSTDELMRLYVARGLSAGSARPETDELIQPVVLSWTDVEGLLRQRQILDAKTLVGVLLFRYYQDHQLVV